MPNGTVIGILGGGQLGRMIAFEAKKMGYDVICMDPTPNFPCGQVNEYARNGSFKFNFSSDTIFLFLGIIITLIKAKVTLYLLVAMGVCSNGGLKVE